VFFKESLISAIIQDFQGNYWVGTNDSGIKLIPSLEIENISNRNSLLSNESILSSLKYNNSIVFGTSKGGLIICDNFGNCSTESVPYITANSQINSLGEWVNNSLITSAGVSYQDINGKEPRFDLPKVTPLSSSRVFQKILNNNDVVLFTRDSRFKIFDKKNNRVINSNTFKKPINSNLNALAQDSQNNIYFGTMNGLYKNK
jgi:ligand-binding sensor domain-containing protein